MTIKIEGNWNKGLAYDVHTLGSTYLGEDENGRKRWDSTRTEMGSLLHGLKYQGKKVNAPKMVDLITAKIKGLDTFDVIVPVPPSKPRPFQPVYELAEELGRRKRVKVLYALEKVTSNVEIKNIENPDERREALEKTMRITGDYDLSGKKVLLLDDLFRSGISLEVATKILYEQTKADTINVLTMTKTRSNR